MNADLLTDVDQQPPYVNPRAATSGGHPNVHQDVPVCAVLIAIFLIGAISNMTIFQRNRRRGHRFFISWALFGFSMARVATFILRLAVANRPTNVSLAIAAGIFTNVGILILYVILLLLALRIFRATHPHLGWNPILRKAIMASYYGVAVALILVVAFTVLTFYTLDQGKRTAALWIQRVAILYLLLFNIAYLVLFLLSVMLPPEQESENFGRYGSMRSKLNILSLAGFATLIIAGFRMGTIWSPPQLASNPPWWDGKVAFYLILFGLEVFVLYFLTFTRIDQRFWVPNGSSKRCSYSGTSGLDDLIGMKPWAHDQDDASQHDRDRNSLQSGRRVEAAFDGYVSRPSTAKKDEGRVSPVVEAVPPLQPGDKAPAKDEPFPLKDTPEMKEEV